MFVFGAGASFDSDPDRLPQEGKHFVDGLDYRPPLAAGLFTPDNREGQAAVAQFPRAAPLLMRLRQATRRGLDIEEVLEQIALGEATYPDTAVQLLAFRAYLAKLLDEVPTEWAEECQGLTNYVLAFDQADRWNKALHGPGGDPLACVTFNYDTLLESAVARVFGHQIQSVEHYVSSPSIHAYKPHGSVNWRQRATWDQPANHWISGGGGLRKAINEAATLDWSSTIRVQANDTYQDDDDATKVWLPALSIPIRRKSTFTMPDAHKSALMIDLAKVSTVIAIGWRARERHFLRLLQEHLPSAPSRLVVVAEKEEAGREACENLWQTGRFNEYAISTLGFSGFVDPLPPEDARHRETAIRLGDVLSGRRGVWTGRTPGRGLVDEPNEAPPAHSAYVEL